MSIKERLFELKDEKYAQFQARLVPGIAPESIIGVRVPVLRKLAKEGGFDDFLQELPHEYYDENMLHGLVISRIKDYDRCIEEVERFLPYVDNWAVCDSMKPGIFKKHKAELLEIIKKWIAGERTYEIRFGIEALMTHYLDEDFDPEYPELVAGVHSDEYYVNMMIAFYFATALAKQWDAVIPYIEEGRLSKWIHNKTIQKSVESFRIDKQQKEYLRKLKNNCKCCFYNISSCHM